MTPVEGTKRVQIADLVRKYLEPHQPHNFHLDVVPDAIQQEDDCYYVVVEPSREDARSYEYYGRLAEAELDLQEKEQLNVLLVPVLPG
ncbi:MAG: hypothetical protein AMXMBFR13_42990 [Phycisphaerae bacterium]